MSLELPTKFWYVYSKACWLLLGNALRTNVDFYIRGKEKTILLIVLIIICYLLNLLMDWFFVSELKLNRGISCLTRMFTRVMQVVSVQRRYHDNVYSTSALLMWLMVLGAFLTPWEKYNAWLRLGSTAWNWLEKKQWRNFCNHHRWLRNGFQKVLEPSCVILADLMLWFDDTISDFLLLDWS